MSALLDVAVPPMATEVAIPSRIAQTVVSHAAYGSDAQVHGAFRWLRANNPLGQVRLPGAAPFWFVSKHADILEISRQNALFPSGELATIFSSAEGERHIRAYTGGSPHILRTFLQMDGPEHPRHRAIIQGPFMSHRIRELESEIRRIAREQVDAMAAMGGECDFVKDVVAWYPLKVILSLMGLPEPDHAGLLSLAQALARVSDPDVNRSHAQVTTAEDSLRDLSAVLEDFRTYFQPLLAGRRAAPNGDLASAVANARIAGDLIDDAQALSHLIFIATAGHETTTSSAAGALWGLCQFPSEFEKARADPGLAGAVADEAIRWVSPVKHFMRSAAQDYLLRDRTIRKGDWLWLSYPSGNRDEEVFEQPDRFLADRTPNRHLAFGYGGHLCIGQHLARLEIRILMEELIPRLRAVTFAAEPAMTESYVIGGPKRLPIRFTLE